MLVCEGSWAEKEMVEGEVRHLLAALNCKTLLHNKLHLFLTPTSMNLLVAQQWRRPGFNP